MLRKLTAAVNLPVSVERAKERLRIDGSESDLDLSALLFAATVAVEKATGRILQASSWELAVSSWPTEIPAAPIREVSGVFYLDANDAEQQIDNANIYWRSTDEGADLFFVDNFSTPVLSTRSLPIMVRFTAGYDDTLSGSGDDPELVLPPTLELAILFLVGHWYEAREAGSQNQNFDVPLTFDFLAKQLKIYR